MCVFKHVRELKNVYSEYCQFALRIEVDTPQRYIMCNWNGWMRIEWMRKSFMW